MEFHLWKSAYQEGFCLVERPTIDDEWEIDLGIPRLSGFPDDVVAKMNPRFPDDIELSDNLSGAGFVIISAALKSFLESKASADPIEYLPLTILNHKQRVASDEYYILHPTHVCDCIDVKASGIEFNPVNNKKILGCKGLVLDPSKIPDESLIFRMQMWGQNILVRNDLVEAMQNEGFTGLFFLSTDGYKGIP